MHGVCASAVPSRIGLSTLLPRPTRIRDVRVGGSVTGQLGCDSGGMTRREADVDPASGEHAHSERDRDR